MSKPVWHVLRVMLCVVAVAVVFPIAVSATPTCKTQTVAFSSLASSGMTVVLTPSSAGECSTLTITGASLVRSGEALTSMNAPTDILTAVNGSSGISICFASGAGDTTVCPALSSPGVLAPIKLTKNGKWEIGFLKLRLTNGQMVTIKMESQVSNGADHFHIFPSAVPEPGSLVLVGSGLLALARKLMA